jgi:hypothetical protein
VLREFVNVVSYALLICYFPFKNCYRCIKERGTLQFLFLAALHLVLLLKIIAYGLEEGEKFKCSMGIRKF